VLFLYFNYYYFVIRLVLYTNVQISQTVELACRSHFSKHVLWTLDILPRQKQGEMHLFDSSKSDCKHILQRLGAAK